MQRSGGGATPPENPVQGVGAAATISLRLTVCSVS
jgi:hypothetical protein